VADPPLVDFYTQGSLLQPMSFTEDDKEALGEDLDELKTDLSQVRVLLTNINTHIKTLTNIAVAMVFVNVIAFVGVIVVVLNSGN
jgi:hypothetical protein